MEAQSSGSWFDYREATPTALMCQLDYSPWGDRRRGYYSECLDNIDCFVARLLAMTIGAQEGRVRSYRLTWWGRRRAMLSGSVLRDPRDLELEQQQLFDRADIEGTHVEDHYFCLGVGAREEEKARPVDLRGDDQEVGKNGLLERL